MEPKSGYKTTEFWITLATMVGAGFGLPVPPEISAVIIGGIGSIYVAARAWVKGRQK